MKDKFNPYGIEKDYECKTCFGQFYDKEIKEHIMVKSYLHNRMKHQGETVDSIRIDFHPICPICGYKNMAVVVHSYSEGSFEEFMEGGRFSMGFRMRGLGFFYCDFLNIN